jgi:hypothetical protein
VKKARHEFYASCTCDKCERMTPAGRVALRKRRDALEARADAKRTKAEARIARLRSEAEAHGPVDPGAFARAKKVLAEKLGDSSAGGGWSTRGGWR